MTTTRTRTTAATRPERAPLAPDWIVAVDPGESSAVAEFKDGLLLGTRMFSVDMILNLAAEGPAPHSEFNAPVMVVEAWRLYPKMAQTMIGSDFLPVQVIGMLRVIARIVESEIIYQLPANAKRFMSDEKLDTYAFDRKMLSNVHKRDAVRHGCWYLARSARLAKASHKPQEARCGAR
jgi:hypothetical protein